MQKFLVSGLVLALVSTLSLSLAYCQKKSGPEPDAALMTMAELWSGGEYAEMYSLLTAAAKENWEQEDFMQRLDKISSGIGLKEVTVKELAVERSGSRAVLDYSLVFNTATVPHFQVDYRLEAERVGGSWQLEWERGHLFPGLSEETVVRVSRLKPQRGRLLDCNLLALAENGQVVEIGIVPGQIVSEEQLTAGLARELALTPEQVQAELNQPWVQPDHFVPVATVSSEQWEEIAGDLEGLAGVSIRRRRGRTYAIPHSLASTVGYVAEVGPSRLQELAHMGFRAGDQLGAAGLELVWDEELRGRPGFVIEICDAEGQVVAPVARLAARDGDDIVTTLDLAMVCVLDQVLGERTGAGLIITPGGQVLAVASKPGFDSNAFALGLTPEQYRELEQLDAPLFNRAFQGCYPPGSVFKPFTALMGLEAGVLDPAEAWETDRQWQASAAWGNYHVTRVPRPSGPVDLELALRWSDNIYFARLALEVGWSDFASFANRFGFGRDIPLFLPAAGSTLSGARTEIALADSGYGQGGIVATPLHMTLLYAGLARGDGGVPVPLLRLDQAEQQWLDSGCSAGNLDLLDRLLRAVVEDRQAMAHIDSPRALRGKTGTAQAGGGRHIAWYICYDEEIVLTIVLEGDEFLGSSQAVAVAQAALDVLDD